MEENKDKKSFHTPCTYGNDNCPKCVTPKNSDWEEVVDDKFIRRISSANKEKMKRMIHSLLINRNKEIINTVFNMKKSTKIQLPAKKFAIFGKTSAETRIDYSQIKPETIYKMQHEMTDGYNQAIDDIILALNK